MTREQAKELAFGQDSFDGDTDPQTPLPYLAEHAHPHQQLWSWLKSYQQLFDHCWVEGGHAHNRYYYSHWYKSYHTCQRCLNSQGDPYGDWSYRPVEGTWPPARAGAYSRLESKDDFGNGLLGHYGTGAAWNNSGFSATVAYNDAVINDEGQEFNYDMSKLVNPPEVVAVGALISFSGASSGGYPLFEPDNIYVNFYLDDVLMNSVPMELPIGQLSSFTYFLVFDNWASSGFQLDGTERTIKLTYEGPIGDPGEIWEAPVKNPDWIRGYNKFASSVNVSTVRFYFKFGFGDG